MLCPKYLVTLLNSAHKVEKHLQDVYNLQATSSRQSPEDGKVTIYYVNEKNNRSLIIEVSDEGVAGLVKDDEKKKIIGTSLEIESERDYLNLIDWFNK